MSEWGKNESQIVARIRDIGPAVDIEQFIVARTRAERHYHEDRWYGISSDALVAFAVGGDVPTERDFPSDPSDLLSCERTLRHLPTRYRDGAESLMAQFRAHVAERYPHQAEFIKAELVGDHLRGSG